MTIEKQNSVRVMLKVWVLGVFSTIAVSHPLPLVPLNQIQWKAFDQDASGNEKVSDACRGLKALPTECIDLVDEFRGVRGYTLVKYFPPSGFDGNCKWADICSLITALPFYPFIGPLVYRDLYSTYVASLRQVHVSSQGFVDKRTQYVSIKLTDNSTIIVLSANPGNREIVLHDSSDDTLKSRFILDSPPYGLIDQIALCESSNETLKSFMLDSPKDSGTVLLCTQNDSTYVFRNEGLSSIVLDGTTSEQIFERDRRNPYRKIRSFVFKAMTALPALVVAGGMLWGTKKVGEYAAPSVKQTVKQSYSDFSGTQFAKNFAVGIGKCFATALFCKGIEYCVKERSSARDEELRRARLEGCLLDVRGDRLP